MQTQFLFVLFLSINAQPFKDIFYGNLKASTSPISQNYLSLTRDQNQPKFCDVSWAFATTTAMAIQYNVVLNNRFPQVVLSPQMLMNCASFDYTCAKDGPQVDIQQVFQNLQQNGVSEEGCNNYYANEERNCSAVNKCKDCANGEDIHREAVCSPYHFTKYRVKSYGKIVTDETKAKAQQESDLFGQIVRNLTQRGPLVCKINHSEEMWNYRTQNSNDVYTEEQSAKTYSAWMTVVGYSKGNNGQSSLIVQSSYGENVGFMGFFRFNFGEVVDDMKLKRNCYWLEVDTDLVVDQNEEKQDYQNYKNQQILKNVKKVQKNLNLNQGLKRVFPLKKFDEQPELLEDPTPVDWRNVNGVNYLTYVKNQHIPSYCGSCWAQAATSVMTDRYYISRMRSQNPFPRLTISVQSVINCAVGGTCFGGDSTLLFQKAMTWKVPIETCQNYQAKNPLSFTCSDDQVCHTNSAMQQYVFKNYQGLKVLKWGRVRGPLAMKNALKDGPLACSFEVTEDFVKYKPFEDPAVLNIYKKEKDYNMPNHAVSLVGWDITADGEEYWIVRNSWGRHWGYDGMFYMKIGLNVLGFEADCSYADTVFVDYQLT